MNINLKLLVISSLIEANELDYEEEYCEEVFDKIDEDEVLSEDMYGLPIPELVDYFAQLDLTSYFNKVNKISLDGGRAIYSIVSYSWDGEDDAFNITSLDGIEALQNLEVLDANTMLGASVSLQPLAQLHKLRQVSLNYKNFVDYEVLQAIESLESVTLTFTTGADVSAITNPLVAKGVNVDVC